MKNFLFAAALLILALASGCATGGSGPCVSNCPTITVNDNDVSVAGVGLSIPLTVTFQNAPQTPVNWAIQPSSCGSACGTLTNVTTSSATYVAPSAVPTNASITIVATSQTSSLSGTLDLTIIPITTDVAPPTPSVGVGLTQPLTAVAVPDNAPQSFTWSCTASGSNCDYFTQDSSVSGLAYYTAASSESDFQIQAFASVDPTGAGCSVNPKTYPCTLGQPTVVASRVSGTYAFQFSGFDANGYQVLVAGTFTATATGTNGGAMISGTADETSWNGTNFSTTRAISISGGTFTPTSVTPPPGVSPPVGASILLNNAGTLTLPLGAGIYPNTYQIVLDGAGDIQIVESDNHGTGSGIAELSSKAKVNPGTSQSFAFGFTGTDKSLARVGYAGLLQTDGNGNVTGGLIDVNDGGNSSNSICSPSAAPCNVAGTYQSNSNGSWTLTLTSPITMTFDFFVANGTTSANSPLTLYAISTDSNPAVLGTMVLQNSKLTYNNAAFNNTSVSALTGINPTASTGTNSNVALVLGTPDGTSSGSGGTGGFSGQFDQNNAGTPLSVSSFPSPNQSPSPYTYVSTNNNIGRYIFYMLGNPNSSPVVPPLKFVLYASGADRGFLLDQSSTGVITGTMTPQQSPKQNDGIFVPSAAPGTYALATNSNSVPGIAPLAMNMVLTSTGNQTYNVSDPEYVETAGSLSGSYTLMSTGTGTIALTAPGAADYIIYATTQTDFFVIQKDAGASNPVSSPIFFMEQ